MKITQTNAESRDISTIYPGLSCFVLAQNRTVLGILLRVRRIPPDSLQSQDTCLRLLAHHPKTSGWSKPAFVPAQQRRHFCGDASSSFKPRAPRHIYCVWAPLGLITTGGMKGWMAGKRTPYPRDPLVYKEHEQSVSHQKNK